MLSIQDDMAPPDTGTGPGIDPITGDMGADVVEAADIIPSRGGTKVGLGARTNDKPTSKLTDLGL